MTGAPTRREHLRRHGRRPGREQVPLPPRSERYPLVDLLRQWTRSSPSPPRFSPSASRGSSPRRWRARRAPELARVVGGARRVRGRRGRDRLGRGPRLGRPHASASTTRPARCSRRRSSAPARSSSQAVRKAAPGGAPLRGPRRRGRARDAAARRVRRRTGSRRRRTTSSSSRRGCSRSSRTRSGRSRSSGSRSRSIRRRPVGNALIVAGIAAAAIGSGLAGLGAAGQRDRDRGGRGAPVRRIRLSHAVCSGFSPSRLCQALVKRS